MVDELIHIGAAAPNVDRVALARDIGRLLRRYAGLPLQDVRAAEVINELRPIIFDYHLKVPSNYWLLGKTLAMMEGIGRKLDPKFDIFAFSRPYVGRLLVQLVLPNQRRVAQFLRQGLLWGDLAREIPRTGLLLMERLRSREAIPLALEKRSLDRLDILFTHLALSLIMTGMTVGIALVIPATIDAVTWLRALLIASFVVTLGLGAWVIFSILRRR